jgi:hypothetical protein
MQPDQHPPESGKIAIRYGLIFGVGLFIIAAILALIATFAFYGSSFASLFSIVYWLIGLVAFFLVGIFAAKKTGKVGTGTLAGLWAGIFDGVLYAIFAIILFFTYTLGKEANTLTNSSTGAHLAAGSAQELAIALIVIVQVFSLLSAIGLGAGLGALGGLVGRATSKAKYAGPGQQPYAGQPYPGQPYAGQPYPGQPYPGQPYPGQPQYPGQDFGQPYPNQDQPSQPEAPQNDSAVSSPEPAQEQETKSEGPANIYNSYLASQEPQSSPPADTTQQADQQH